MDVVVFADGRIPPATATLPLLDLNQDLLSQSQPCCQVALNGIEAQGLVT